MAWYQIKERGTMFGYWFVYYLRRILGYRVTLFFCRFIVLYYFLFATTFKKAVKTFLIKATGGYSLAQLHETFLNFSVAIIDRLYFLHGYGHKFTPIIHNSDVVDAIIQRGSGAILLGSHIGPMEASRLIAESKGYSVSALIYSAISPRLFYFMKRIAPDIEQSFIQVKPDSIDYILEVKQRIDDGGFVGILGDRPWQTGKIAEAEFLGEKTLFPMGAYEMALSIGCPIVMTFALKTGFRQYDIFFELLTAGEHVPRSTRAVAADRLMKGYVARLEHYARTAPTQWYNFYDYWDTSRQIETR